MKDRKTDYGTVILHWLFAAGLGVAFVTGLRIATEAPDRQWLNFLDAILPRENRIVSSQPQQIAVQLDHLQIRIALVPIQLAFEKRPLLGRMCKLSFILPMLDSGELPHKLAAAVMHQLGQLRFVVRKI